MRIHYKSCLLCFGIQNIIFPKTPCSYSIDMQPTFHKLDVAMWDQYSEVSYDRKQAEDKTHILMMQNMILKSA